MEVPAGGRIVLDRITAVDSNVEKVGLLPPPRDDFVCFTYRTKQNKFCV